MTTLQAMLLGAMIVLTPSLLVLAFVLRGIPGAPGEDPDWLEVDPSDYVGRTWVCACFSLVTGRFESEILKGLETL